MYTHRNAHKYIRTSKSFPAIHYFCSIYRVNRVKLLENIEQCDSVIYSLMCTIKGNIVDHTIEEVWVDILFI